MINEWLDYKFNNYYLTVIITIVFAAYHDACMYMTFKMNGRVFADSGPRPTIVGRVYFEGINFRGWTITKDFADFIFVV